MSEDSMQENDIGGGSGKPPESNTGPERNSPKGSFWNIQRKLERDWDNMPQKEKRELLDKRQKLINEAEAEGLFKGVKAGFADFLRGTEWNDLTNDSVTYKEQQENAARRLYSDHPEWEMMVETAIEGEIALAKRNGIRRVNPGPQWHESHYTLEAREQINRDVQSKRLGVDLGAGDNPEELVAYRKEKREREMREVYGEPQAETAISPDALRSYLNAQGQGNGSTNRMVELFENIFAGGGPLLQIRSYRAALSYLGAFDVQIGNEPRFFPSISPEQRLQWRAMSTLSKMAGFKFACIDSTKLINSDAIQMTKSELETLLTKEGTNEAVSLYTYMISNDVSPVEILLPVRLEREVINKNDKPEEKLDKDNQYYDRLRSMLGGTLQAQDERVLPRVVEAYVNEIIESIKKCPDSIFDIKDGSQLFGLRNAMKSWLILNKDLKVDVFNYTKRPPAGEDRELEQNEVLVAGRGVTNDDATESEAIAWDLVYYSNLIEDKDSRFDSVNTHAKRMKNIQRLKSLPVWMMMHLQERLEDKVNGKPPDTPPERWSQFGNYAVNRKKRLFAKLRGWGPEDEDVLPPRLFTNSFEEVSFEDKKKAYEITKNKKQEKVNLLQLFNYNGEELDKNANSDIIKPTFENMGDAPFAGYELTTIIPAITIFKVIVFGKQQDINLKAVADAASKLFLSKKYRKRVRMAWSGVKPKAGKVTPAEGWSEFNKQGESLRRYGIDL